MKKTNPAVKVSVIIPFFNHGEYIDEAIKSIRDQTFQHFEILIIDDCSTDKHSKKKLQQLEKKKNIQVLYQKKNGGPAKARNRGVGKSTGDFVLLLDADDRFERTFVEKALILLDQHPDRHFVYCYIQHFGADNSVYKTHHPYNFYEELFENKICGNCLIRRQAWDQVGGQDENLHQHESEDWDFWIRLGKKDLHGLCLPEPLFYYRKLERSRLSGVRKSYDKVVKNIRRRHRELYLWPNLWRLRRKWKKVTQTNKGSKGKLFAHAPQFAQRVGLKFFEAELLEPAHWKTSPLNCFQLMIPVRFRQKLNDLFGKEFFPSHTKFSDFPHKKSSQTRNAPHPLRLGKTLPSSKKSHPSVLVFLPWIPMGGVENLMLMIFRHLGNEFDFWVFTTQRNENSMHPDFAAVSTVFHLPNLFKDKEAQKTFVFQKIQDGGFQHIFIVNSLFAFKLIPQIKARFPDIPLSTSIHGWDGGFDFFTMAELFFPFLQSVICVSDTVKKRFEKRIGGGSDKVKLIRNSVDFHRLEIREGNTTPFSVLKRKDPTQKNIVFLGRYHFDKRPHVFIDIANFLVRRFDMTHFRFFLFGEGTDEDALKKRAKDINRKAGEEVVHVEGKEEDVARIFSGADACVNCSPREGFGMSNVESIFFGVPVVGLDLEVFREVLPPKYFFPVEREKDKMLASFARQIFAAAQMEISDTEKKKMRQWVRKTFDENTFYEAYREVFLSGK